MDFFSQTYIALRGPTGAPQSPVDTIAKLTDRLSPSTLLADRRAAVLSLKGLVRDCKADVGDRALPGLIHVLQHDAEVDLDIGKAVLETLHCLCIADDDDDRDDDNTVGPAMDKSRPKGRGRELALKHTDYFLADPQAALALLKLLADPRFHIRYLTLQLLSTLVQNRRAVVQTHFLKASNAVSGVIAILADQSEIIRNEGILMLQSLITHSPDIQKVLAFEGAFERLFDIVRQGGGVEGDATIANALRCVDGLLRFNSSNQSYFRDTSLPAFLCSLLLFPPNLQLQVSPPQEFALQYWDQKKAANTSLLVGIMGMLIGSKGSHSQHTPAFMRCLVELALASNAPTLVKTQALQVLPSNLAFPLADVVVTPYMPVPETNGEEWDRLEPASALDVLVELALHGEYNNLYGDSRTKDSLDLRASALGVFDNFARKEETRQAIMQGLLASTTTSSISPLLHGLCLVPSVPLDIANVTTTHFATLVFAHLLASSPQTKAIARSIKPCLPALSAQGETFVPADGVPDAAPPAEDEDVPQSILQQLTENLSLCFISRSHVEDGDERQGREWDRLIVGYLSLLIQWLWEDPKAVAEFLDGGGLGVLVEPINQTTKTEGPIPGLCALLLGVCYEFNREPGEITRSTIHPIVTRLTVDGLIGHMACVRDDERFKAVGPESMVLVHPSSAPAGPSQQSQQEQESEIWFDWAFVDFWKSNQYAVQRALGAEPDALASSSGSSAAASAMLISSLREAIRVQAEEIDALKVRLKEKDVVVTSTAAAAEDEVNELRRRVGELEDIVRRGEEKRKEVEKEQEDLLVLLDEMSAKRKRDKGRMREAGLEASEDEEEDEDEDEENEDGDGEVDEGD